MSNKVNKECNCDQCNSFFEKPMHLKKKAYQDYLTSKEYRAHKLWNSFDIDIFMPERELVDNYTEDLTLIDNPDWLLWELEMQKDWK